MLRVFIHNKQFIKPLKVEDFCSKYDIHHQIDRLFFQYLYSQKSQNVCVCKLLMLVYICRREKAISEREREREREREK